MNYIWNMTTVTDQDNMYINVDLVWGYKIK
jgi:hypothetical protein